MHLPSRSGFPPFACIAAAAFLAAAASAATPAAAEVVAYTTTSVNQRVGPGTTYDVIQTVPQRTRIVVYGCLQPVDWCEVDYQGRGWMLSDYIQAYYQGAYYPVAKVAAYLGVPAVTFSVAQNSRPSGNVSNANFGVFYDRLSPYGHWVSVSGQYVWVPGGVSRDWRPYQDGRWVYTQQYGWTWASNEPFGWATYHYGRWAFSKSIGWFWVPGTRWAPAWVAWRGSNDHIAWAPLPPDSSSGLSISINIGTVPNYYWQVVPTSAFLSVNLNKAIVRDDQQTATFIQQSKPLGAVQVQGQEVVNNPLDVKMIENQTRQRVVPHQITTVQDPKASGQVSDTSVQVFAPSTANTTTTAAPAQPKQVTPLTEVEQQSQTKGQAGNQPATDNLVVAPTPEQQPTAAAAATGQQPGTAEQQQPTAPAGTQQACPEGAVLQPDGSCAPPKQPTTGGAATTTTPTAPSGAGAGAGQEPPPPPSTTPSNGPPPPPKGGTSAGPTTEQQPTTVAPATGQQPGTAGQQQPTAPAGNQQACPKGTTLQVDGSCAAGPPPKELKSKSKNDSSATSGTTSGGSATEPPPPQSTSPSNGQAPSTNGGTQQACPKGTTLQADGSCAPKQPEGPAPSSNGGSAAKGGSSTEAPPPPTDAPATQSQDQPAAGQPQPTDQAQPQSNGGSQQPKPVKCPDGQPAQADGSCPAQPPPK